MGIQGFLCGLYMTENTVKDVVLSFWFFVNYLNNDTDGLCLKWPHISPVWFYEFKIDKLKRYKYINKPINKMKSRQHINHRHTLPSHNKYTIFEGKKFKERQFKAFGLKSSHHYHKDYFLSQPFFYISNNKQLNIDFFLQNLSKH